LGENARLRRIGEFSGKEPKQRQWKIIRPAVFLSRGGKKNYHRGEGETPLPRPWPE